MGLAVAIAAGWLALPLVPLPPALFIAPERVTGFLDRHGRPLREVASGGQVSRPVVLGEVAPALIEATLAAEDARFWDHPGVDVRASLRAGWQFVRHRRVVSGGSTITQQLIKLAEPRPRTFRTKVIEAVQALRLEQVWSKQQVLAAYLDRIEYGRRRQGCEAAAAFYFGRRASDLSVAEAAFLAGLPQSPGRLDPHLHFDRAKRRQEWILNRLVVCGWLEAAGADRARREPLRLLPPRGDFQAPHFVDLLLQLDPAAGTLARTGRVRTSLDLELNEVARDLLRRHLAGLRDRNVRNGAVVILDNATGEVRALVGSEDYFAPDAGQVNGAWAPRSPGSTLKPFTVALALERGWTPASVIPDVPTEFPTATGVFAPVNYDRRWLGPVRLRTALASSLNVPAVRLLHDLGGADLLQERLEACGLSTLTRPPGHYGLGLTLGNAEVRLLELASAYATLGRLGLHQPFRLLATDAPGGPPAARRVFEREAAWLVADILADSAARAPAFGFDSPLAFAFPVACKTGTSTDFRDNWALGFTPEFTVGVWVGNFDGSPMQGVSGVTGAAPVLHDLFEHLHARHGTSAFPRPDSMVQHAVHPLTGHRLAQPGPGALREWFATAHPPPDEIPADYGAAGQVLLGGEYRDWFAQGHTVPGAGLAGAGAGEATTDVVRILSPATGTVFYLDPDLPDGGRRVRLRAAGPDRVTWTSPTLEIKAAGEDSFALLTEGRHKIEVRTPDGRSGARTWIEVRRL